MVRKTIHRTENNDLLLSVSYTHLDVYKRQNQKSKPLNRTVMDIFIIAILIVAAVILFLVELFIIPGLSLIHIQMCIRDSVSLQQDIDRYACYSPNQHTLLLVNGLRLSNETSHNRCPIPVSYTHLDVYKRQGYNRALLLSERH